MMKKQALEEVTYKIDAYFMKNNITTIKVYTTQTLSSRNIMIQITNEEEAKKLRKENS